MSGSTSFAKRDSTPFYRLPFQISPGYFVKISTDLSDQSALWEGLKGLERVGWNFPTMKGFRTFILKGMHQGCYEGENESIRTGRCSHKWWCYQASKPFHSGNILWNWKTWRKPTQTREEHLVPNNNNRAAHVYLKHWDKGSTWQPQVNLWSLILELHTADLKILHHRTSAVRGCE